MELRRKREKVLGDSSASCEIKPYQRRLKYMAKYQASLYYSRAHMPFWFASHCWIVINNNGVVSRWEVLFRKHACPTSWGNLHKNYLPPNVGIEIIPYYLKYLWKGYLIGSIEGDENSTAQKLVNFVENSYLNYPFRDRYFFIGPNSNTYPQWIINHFPEFKINLPWNSFGKGYKISEPNEK